MGNPPADRLAVQRADSRPDRGVDTQEDIVQEKDILRKADIHLLEDKGHPDSSQLVERNRAQLVEGKGHYLDCTGRKTWLLENKWKGHFN